MPLRTIIKSNREVEGKRACRSAQMWIVCSLIFCDTRVVRFLHAGGLD